MSFLPSRPTALLFLLALSAPPVLGCSGDDTNPPLPVSPGADGGAHDGSTPTTDASSSSDAGILDSGSVEGDASSDGSVPYPAFAIPLPQVKDIGGVILAQPRIVPVVFAGDDPAFRSQILAFLTALPASDYWKTAASEYHVTGATVTAPVLVTDPAPATIDDSVIQSWIADHLSSGGVDAGGADSGTSAWPASDGNSIYIVFYPAGTTVTISSGQGAPASQSCTDFGAYHDEDDALDNGATAYAVIPRCNGYLGHDGIDFVTGAATHELLEAATDPFPQSNGAYDDTDFNGSGWDLNSGGPEIGDLCKLETTAFFRPATFDYLVQRMWSNDAAKSGHEPCVPNLPGAGPYFTAFPDLEGVEAYPSYYVSGINVPPGTSRQIPIHLVSDAPTGPWTVSAVEQGSPQAPPDPDHLLSFAWDTTKGKNGDTVHLTITRAATPATTSTHGLPLVISSTMTAADGGTTTNSFWTIVGE